jgi:anaerobic dimethyl sulfoxide reductase subunit C (anchor subunit)
MQIEWALVLFTTVSGAGACLFVAHVLGFLLEKDGGTGNATSRIEPAVALALTVLGGVFSVLHLAHPERILEALNRPTSGIFIEAALVGILSLVIVIYLVAILRKASFGVLKVIGIVGAIVAVVLAFECGASYVMQARANWNTWALPLAYLGTAVAAGTAANLLVKTLRHVRPAALRFAGASALVGSALGIVTTLAYYLASGGDLFSVEENLSVWVLVLFVGLVLACVLSAVVIRNIRAGTGVAADRNAEAAISAADGGVADAVKTTGNTSAVLAGIVVACALVAAIALRVTMWLLGTGTLDFFQML